MVWRDGPGVTSDSRRGRNLTSGRRHELGCARGKASPRDLQPSFSCKRTQVLTQRLTLSVGWSPNVARVVITPALEPSADSTLHNGCVKEITGKCGSFRISVRRRAECLSAKA